MGLKTFQLKLRTNYTSDELNDEISKLVGNKNFSYAIEKKSLDARKKNDIHWLMNVVVNCPKFKEENLVKEPRIEIPNLKTDEKVLVVGSGPAGFFAAQVLQKAGFKVTLIEQGSDVERRTRAINNLDYTGVFSKSNNYAFGEGGAGTFSDGKLTSRSKHISAERLYILNEYVKAGAPDEILYLAHPHVGTDNLKVVVKNLRQDFEAKGGNYLFDTQLIDFKAKNGKVTEAITSNGSFEVDHLVVAIGHSSYETYRMLIKNGVQFGTKNFAIGHRIEHPQSLINRAQWGVETLEGVKAAEYRLATTSKSGLPIYSFCMCPGGTVVPAAAYEGKSVVNGMSNYARDGKFANSGMVVGVNADALLGKTSTALEALEYLDKLEERFFNFREGYTLPANTVQDYIKNKTAKTSLRSSYPLGIYTEPLQKMIPEFVYKALVEGLTEFSKKIRGFENGVLMGLESKTSSPIQVAREKTGKCLGFNNLYMIGEGSGFSGGIISSAADGVKCALSICFL